MLHISHHAEFLLIASVFSIYIEILLYAELFIDLVIFLFLFVAPEAIFGARVLEFLHFLHGLRLQQKAM